MKMIKRWFLITVLVFGLLLFFINERPSGAEKFPTSLTVLYTNNINGEIDPCPV